MFRLLLGLAATLVGLPVAVWLAFSAHEPTCPEQEAFWNGDRPVVPDDGEGHDVEAVVLGSSHLGMGIDLARAAMATQVGWQRIARHAVATVSLPRSYAWMLASTDASPGMRALVIEASPLLMDVTTCGRAPLANVAVHPSWWWSARAMLGEDAPLASAVAAGGLPHRWLMSSGRRSDLLAHAKHPRHALGVLADLPRLRRGLPVVTRWPGERVPDLDEARIRRRREALLGAPMEAFVPEVDAGCVDALADVIRAARAERTLVVAPPMRARMRAGLDPAYLRAFDTALEAMATSLAPLRVDVWDATDAFVADEEGRFEDFDHLSAEGAALWTDAIVTRVLPSP